MVPPRLLKSPAGCNKRPPSPQSNSLNLTPTQPGAGHTLCPPSPQSNASSGQGSLAGKGGYGGLGRVEELFYWHWQPAVQPLFDFEKAVPFYPPCCR